MTREDIQEAIARLAPEERAKLRAWLERFDAEQAGDVLQVSDGSLYPALHKLEQEGWITAEWKQTENNRRAKYYTLTREGRRALKEEAAQWERLSAAISGIVRLA